MSRPFVLALLGAILAVATFATMRAAGDRAQADQSSAAPVVVPAKPPSHANKSKNAAAPDSKAVKPAVKPVAKPTPHKPAAIAAGVPPKVARALKAKKTVVLFFRQPAAADDDATQAAVRSLRGKKRVAVFSDGIVHLSRYRRIVTGLGITQAPSVVIVGKSHKAVLIEGFVDAGSLSQQVLDAR